MDPELEAIRAKRLAELSGGSHQQQQSQEGQQEEALQQQKQTAENARQNILVRILSNDARDRISRISLVKAERARAIEDFLINAARTGAIRGGSSEDGRLSETDLVNIINQIEMGQEKKTVESKIKFQRRTYSDDEDF